MTVPNSSHPAVVRPEGPGQAPLVRGGGDPDRVGSARRGAPPTLVAVAHGSRDPRALTTVQALLDLVRELRPDVPVRLGHIELNEPLLSDTLAALPPGRAVLVPLLLGRGHHLAYDLPNAAAAAPHLDTRVGAALGPHPLLAEILHDRLTEAGWQQPPGTRGGARGVPGAVDAPGTPSLAHHGHPTGPHGTAVVLAAAGSRDPQGAVDARRAAALLARRLGVPVVAAFASATTPTVPQALGMLADAGRQHAAVASYFTAPGRFAAQCAAAATGPAAAPLGAHPKLARLLLHRYDQACREPVHRPARHHRLTAA